MTGPISIFSRGEVIAILIAALLGFGIGVMVGLSIKFFVGA